MQMRQQGKVLAKQRTSATTDEVTRAADETGSGGMDTSGTDPTTHSTSSSSTAQVPPMNTNPTAKTTIAKGRTDVTGARRKPKTRG